MAQAVDLANAVARFGVDARRHLHRHPELSFQEKETMTFVVAHLKEMGYEPQAYVGGFGVKLVIRGGRPGRTVLLRADMDALPIKEETGLPFASQHDGVMHACGHDLHTATLLATARALKEIAPALHGNVVLCFQPAEETPPGGAQAMLRDGLLEHPQVDAAFGLHIDPFLPVGRLAFLAGPRNAASDSFELKIIGRGGHGAQPHRSVDPILTACQTVVALQAVHSRQVDPFDPLVVTIGAFHGGTKHNIIPESVTLQGTVRTHSDALWNQVPELLERTVAGVTSAYGARYQLDYRRGYPVLINDAAMAALATEAAVAAIGADQVDPAKPGMGGEDFAYIARAVPACFGSLGVAPADRPLEQCYPVHHPRLLVADEGALPVGVAYYLSLVQRYLSGE